MDKKNSRQIVYITIGVIIMLGALLVKIANEEKLTAVEMQQLKQEAGRMDEIVEAAGGWLSGVGTESPKFNTPSMNTVNWGSTPLGFLSIQRVADVTVLNNTKTFITFDTSQQFKDVFILSSDGTKVLWDGVSGKAFGISGYAIWTADGTGYRGLWLEGFDEDDNSLGTAPLHTVAGQSLIDNVIPVSFDFYFNGFSYLKFYVQQTSGGNLDLKELTLGISLR